MDCLDSLDTVWNDADRGIKEMQSYELSETLSGMRKVAGVIRHLRKSQQKKCSHKSQLDLDWKVLDEMADAWS